LRSKQQKTGIKISTGTRTSKSKSLTVASILRALSDPKSVELFKSISAIGSDSSDLRSTTRLSPRQYYSRLSNFTRNGMLIKKNGKKYRTTFGRIVYYELITIEKAILNYYKLKAIDSIGLYNDMPHEEHKKIIDALITDPDIREILSSPRD
jgi:DNA-binding transcriptional ArsR family regulator